MEDNNNAEPTYKHTGRKLKSVTLTLLSIQCINMGLLTSQALGAEHYNVIMFITIMSLILNVATAWFAFGWINYITDLLKDQEERRELINKISRLNFDLLKELTQLHMYHYSQHVKPQPFHGDN